MKSCRYYFTKKNLLLTFIVLLNLTFLSNSISSTRGKANKSLNDSELIKRVPGFKNSTVEVNGIKLHIVEGGTGTPIVLLPGWPQTWWAYHKILIELSKAHHVIVVEIRGMGSSDRPADGFDKRTMAKDISEIVKKFGLSKVIIAGHDIGAQVAWSFAANFPEQTEKLIMLDVPHPDEGLYKIPILPVKNTFTDKRDNDHPYLWWFAFHQVKGLPEKLLAGRVHLEQEWFFKYQSLKEEAISSFDKSVYAQAYNSKDSIRASNAWYQAIPQDIDDEKTYKKLEMPVLGIAGTGIRSLTRSIENKSTNFKIKHIESCGHFLPEECPEETLKLILDFIK